MRSNLKHLVERVAGYKFRVKRSVERREVERLIAPCQRSASLG